MLPYKVFITISLNGTGIIRIKVHTSNSHGASSTNVSLYNNLTI
jgi:hypothetical protein